MAESSTIYLLDVASGDSVEGELRDAIELMRAGLEDANPEAERGEELFFCEGGCRLLALFFRAHHLGALAVFASGLQPVKAVERTESREDIGGLFRQEDAEYLWPSGAHVLDLHRVVVDEDHAVGADIQFGGEAGEAHAPDASGARRVRP